MTATVSAIQEGNYAKESGVKASAFTTAGWIYRVFNFNNPI
jgi:hypothetical protein